MDDSTRQLTTRQGENLFSMLHKVPGQCISFEFVAGDPEATQFAAQLIGIFQRAEWFVEKLAEIPAGDTFGVVLLANEYDGKTHETLRQSFSSLGVELEMQMREDYPSGRITLRIGHRRGGL